MKRGAAISKAYVEHGYTLSQIGDFLGPHYAHQPDREVEFQVMTERNVALQDLTPVPLESKM